LVSEGFPISNNRTLWFAVVLVALLALFAFIRPPAPSAAVAPSPETTVERIKRTKTLACAYYLWPNLLEKNPNTGEMTGVVVDVANKVAEALGAKVEWREEATIDNFIQLINAKRVDALCAPFSAIAPFIHTDVRFSHPIYYGRFDAFVRADDTRFDEGAESVNKPDVKFLTLDGSAAAYLSSLRFPNVQKNGLAAVMGAGQTLLDVKDKKADITVVDELTAGRFLDSYPGSLKPLRWNGQSLLVAGVSPFLTKIDDVVWSRTLDALVDDLVTYGVVDKILTDHGFKAGWHYQPVALPYDPR
jgi:ABC-type amino acid transport substrate-binding protein